MIGNLYRVQENGKALKEGDIGGIQSVLNQLRLILSKIVDFLKESTYCLNKRLILQEMLILDNPWATAVDTPINKIILMVL